MWCHEAGPIGAAAREPGAPSVSPQQNATFMTFALLGRRLLTA
jgi:hypothetical protein